MAHQLADVEDRDGFDADHLSALPWPSVGAEHRIARMVEELSSAGDWSEDADRGFAFADLVALSLPGAVPSDRGRVRPLRQDGEPVEERVVGEAAGEPQVGLPFGPVVEGADLLSEEFVELLYLFASGLVGGRPLFRGIATRGHRRAE